MKRFLLAIRVRLGHRSVGAKLRVERVRGTGARKGRVGASPTSTQRYSHVRGALICRCVDDGFIQSPDRGQPQRREHKMPPPQDRSPIPPTRPPRTPDPYMPDIPNHLVFFPFVLPSFGLSHPRIGLRFPPPGHPAPPIPTCRASRTILFPIHLFFA